MKRKKKKKKKTKKAATTQVDSDCFLFQCAYFPSFTAGRATGSPGSEKGKAARGDAGMPFLLRWRTSPLMLFMQSAEGSESDEDHPEQPTVKDVQMFAEGSDPEAGGFPHGFLHRINASMRTV